MADTLDQIAEELAGCGYDARYLEILAVLKSVRAEARADALRDADQLDEALSAAWLDLKEWIRLAKEQRAAHPNPNYSANMPSEAGIRTSEAVVRQIEAATRILLRARATEASK
jgi:hypothetical protein